MRVCCQLPSCSPVLLPLLLPEKRLAHLLPSSFSPHLSLTSDSVRNSPVTSGCVTAEVFGCRCRFCLRLWRSLRFVSVVGSAFGFDVAFGSILGFVSTLLLAISSFTVSDFESCPSSSRSSRLFSPDVGFALVLPTVGCVLVLPTVGCVLVLPAVGFALVLPAVVVALSVLWIFSC